MKFEWEDKCQSSFEQLKKIQVEAPVLTQPTPGKEYTLYSDASKIGLGCFKDWFRMCINAKWKSKGICLQTDETT